MTQKIDRNYWLLAIAILVVAAGTYFYWPRSGLSNVQNTAQDIQCQSLGSKFYSEQQKQSAEDNTPSNVQYLLGTPYYKYSSELNACLYLVEFSHPKGGPEDTGQYQLFDLTHSNSVLANFYEPYGPDIDSMDQAFCKTFNSLFGSDVAKYKNAGVDRTFSQLLWVADQCSRVPNQ